MADRTDMKEILKRKTKAFIELMPWGADLYHRYWIYPRADDRVLGVFPDYDAALKVAGGRSQANYDRNNVKKTREKEQQIVDDYFQDSDYPALFWLSRIMTNESRIIELGGSVGYAFYSYRRRLTYPEGMRWTIVELPEAVRLGREIAAARSEQQLSFTESIGDCGQCSIFLTSGTLQYIQRDVSDMIREFPKAPDHLIINRVPVYDGEEYWTVQNLGTNKVPYRIHCRKRLIDSLAELGYELHDTWKKPRKVFVPFAPERTVENYEGFYLRHTNAVCLR
jgi:putative methyltransferase (TIGR04325 family)